MLLNIVQRLPRLTILKPVVLSGLRLRIQDSRKTNLDIASKNNNISIVNFSNQIDYIKSLNAIKNMRSEFVFYCAKVLNKRITPLQQSVICKPVHFDYVG